MCRRIRMCFLDFLDESFSSSSREEKLDDVSSKILEACAGHRIGAVKKLVNKDNVNSIYKKHTALITACRAGHLNVAQYLVGIGANVLKPGEYNFSPLHAACSSGSFHLVKFLLENGADKGVNLMADGFTPLGVIARNGKDRDGKIMELLIKYGARVDVRGAYTNTPLVYAVANQTLHSNTQFRPQSIGALRFRPSPIQALLDAGADPDKCCSYSGNTLTLSMKTPKMFHLLVENGANVNAYPLYVEPPKIHIKCIEMLLDYNAGVDIPCTHSENCRYDRYLCAYFRYRTAYCHNTYTVRGISAAARRFEEHMLKMEVAGLYFGKGRPANLLTEWYRSPVFPNWHRKKFRKECQAELTKMSLEKIAGTGVTYLDVLHQRRRALLAVGDLPLVDLKYSFPIYSGLIRSRLLTGKRKLSLMDECWDVFSRTDLPHLPSLPAFQILSYLSEQDLKQVEIARHSPRSYGVKRKFFEEDNSVSCETKRKKKESEQLNDVETVCSTGEPCASAPDAEIWNEPHPGSSKNIESWSAPDSCLPARAGSWVGLDPREPEDVTAGQERGSNHSTKVDSWQPTNIEDWNRHVSNAETLTAPDCLRPVFDAWTALNSRYSADVKAWNEPDCKQQPNAGTSIEDNSRQPADMETRIEHSSWQSASVETSDGPDSGQPAEWTRFEATNE